MLGHAWNLNIYCTDIRNFYFSVRVQINKKHSLFRKKIKQESLFIILYLAFSLRQNSLKYSDHPNTDTPIKQAGTF